MIDPQAANLSALDELQKQPMARLAHRALLHAPRRQNVDVVGSDVPGGEEEDLLGDEGVQRVEDRRIAWPSVESRDFLLDETRELRRARAELAESTLVQRLIALPLRSAHRHGLGRLRQHA